MSPSRLNMPIVLRCCSPALVVQVVLLLPISRKLHAEAVVEDLADLFQRHAFRLSKAENGEHEA